MNNVKSRSVSAYLLSALTFGAALTTMAQAENPSKTVESGATWVVKEKFEIGGLLMIKNGATMQAPEGSLLVMTVDGVETAIAPGSYTGKIVLTPQAKITKSLYDGFLGKGANTDYRTGLFVDGGKIVEKSSVTSALAGGKFDATAMMGVSINSNNVLFNGLILHDSNYSVNGVRMTANGAGVNDFTGYGAGIAVTGKSRVDIDRYSFEAVGPLRHGIFVGGIKDARPTVRVTNSFLKTDGTVGDLVPGTNMANVPWVLGLEDTGRVRTQLLVGYGDVTYKNSTLLSDGWGVVSTDDTGAPDKYGDYSLILKVKDSLVDITGTSGYGSYSIGASRNIFNHSVLGDTKYSTSPYGLTYGLIVANEYAAGDFINGTEVTARYGVMYHKNQTGVTNVQGSGFHTQGAVFLIKHCYPVINVSSSKLVSDSGIILQLMSSDDPGLATNVYSEALDAATVAKDAKHDIYNVNKVDVEIFKNKLTGVVTDAQASFADMDIKGDFYNSVTGVDDDDLHLLGQNLVLNFDDVDLTGVISSAVALHRNYTLYFGKEQDTAGNKIPLTRDGLPIEARWEEKPGIFGLKVKTLVPALDAKGEFKTTGGARQTVMEGAIMSRNATWLGDLVNQPAKAVNNGVLVTLKGGTTWTVTGASYLTGLTLEHARIVAPAGKKVAMTVNGAPTVIKEDTSYKGDIVITVQAQ